MATTTGHQQLPSREDGIGLALATWSADVTNLSRTDGVLYETRGSHHNISWIETVVFLTQLQLQTPVHLQRRCCRQLMSGKRWSVKLHDTVHWSRPRPDATSLFSYRVAIHVHLNESLLKLNDSVLPAPTSSCSRCQPSCVVTTGSNASYRSQPVSGTSVHIYDLRTM